MPGMKMCIKLTLVQTDDYNFLILVRMIFIRYDNHP